MPKRLIAVSVLFIVVGSLALVAVVLDMLGGHGATIDFSFCMLPVGIGLLHGKRSSRRWATFWAGYAISAAVLGTAAGILDGGFDEIRFAVWDVTGTWADALGWSSIAFIMALALAVIRVLHSKPVSSCFELAPSLEDFGDQHSPGESGTGLTSAST